MTSQPIFKKFALVPQDYVKNSHKEIKKNSTKSVVADIKLQTGRRREDVTGSLHKVFLYMLQIIFKYLSFTH